MNDKNNVKSGREESYKPCEVNSCESNEVHSFAEIIRKAQQGDRTSMGQLVEAAEPRLLTYIFRLTLSQDLSEELCQKTLVKMVQSLETLKNVDKFWYWLLRHAMGEVQHYYRDQKRQHEVEFEALNRERGITVVMVTHDPEVAARAGRTVHLLDGVISNETAGAVGHD